MSSEIVLDIEANGFQPTEIFCVVCMKVGSEVPLVFTDRYQFAQYVQQNKEALWYAHNGLRYDFPVLRGLWDIAIPIANQRDTLVLSRLASPSRDGGHSLGSWGDRLNFPKGDHSDFTKCTPELIRYCKRDVELNVAVLEELKKELEGFSEESIKLEHEVAPIIFQQEQNGWLMDERKVFLLLAELKEKKLELEEAVRATFPPIAKSKRQVSPKRKKDGTLSKVGLGHLGDCALRIVGGCHTVIEWQEFNLGSRPQIGERLQRAGWVPTAFTETGQPKVDETILSRVQGIPEAQLIADYLTIEKRIGMAQSWLDLLGDDGRMHGRVNSNGAVTGRMTHNSPNMAQVTSGSKIYGKEMRECWIARKGYKIVGCDASGLELRMLAHYMNDAAYTKEILEGDVHTANQNAAGLDTRDQAKTFIYAFLYGAGDAKIGSIAGGSKQTGSRLKQRFLSATPSLRDLKQRVERAAGRGWLKGLDGRRIAVRSSHAALNTLLQGAGAVVMKKALVLLDEAAREAGINYYFVGNIHDEIQTEVAANEAEAFGNLAVAAIVKAGEHYNLRCPLAAEFKIGDNWSETH